MMTKEIKAAVKTAIDSLDMGFIKINDGSYNGKVLVRAKGMCAGQVGPMTVTNAWLEKNISVQEKVIKAFSGIEGLEMELGDTYHGRGMQNVKFKFALNSNRTQVINFMWQKLPTYARSLGYDSSYETYWLSMSKDELVKGE